MSGSGSTVYGIYSNKQSIKQAYNDLKNKYKAFFCISVNK